MNMNNLVKVDFNKKEEMSRSEIRSGFGIDKFNTQISFDLIDRLKKVKGIDQKYLKEIEEDLLKWRDQYQDWNSNSDEILLFIKGKNKNLNEDQYVQDHLEFFGLEYLKIEDQLKDLVENSLNSLNYETYESTLINVMSETLSRQFRHLNSLDCKRRMVLNENPNDCKKQTRDLTREIKLRIQLIKNSTEVLTELVNDLDDSLSKV